MKRSTYYQEIFGRTNIFKKLFAKIFIAVASLPRMLLEVFIRRNFGERYFSLTQAILLAVFLAGMPYITTQMRGYGGYGGTSFWSIITHDPTWYSFIILFLSMCVRRQKEVNTLPSVFDFARFSLSTGEINQKFYDIKIGSKAPSTKLIATVYEPLFFFLIGLFLIFCRQSVGLLILVSSIFYSFGYYAAYYLGDEYMMDKIDEIMCKEDLGNMIADGMDAKERRGVTWYGQFPGDSEMKKKLVDSINDDEGFNAF